MQTLGQPFSLGDHLLHLVMPATVLGTELSATLARYTRSSLLEVLGEDYVTTARAKGLNSIVVLFRHALRNALLPVITILGVRLPRLFSGAVIIEQIFVWPGIGMLSIRAVIERDYPVLMGVSLIVAVLVVLSNLITDITYAYVDPRIRYD
jgi:peptide/nickel transport system permease protein